MTTFPKAQNCNCDLNPGKRCLNCMEHAIEVLFEQHDETDNRCDALEAGVDEAKEELENKLTEREVERLISDGVQEGIEEATTDLQAKIDTLQLRIQTLEANTLTARWHRLLKQLRAFVPHVTITR